jgi:AcrR family transcriptional regulator
LNTTVSKRTTRSPSEKTSSLSRQAQKSLLTQTSVLEATIACLVDLGYYNTTMERIAKRAKVSRGAMMHHYRDRADLIEKTARYLAEKRISEFEKLSRTITDPVPEGKEPTIENSSQGIELTRRFHAMPSFVALHELLLAARTDKQLADVMRQCQQTINDDIPKRILKLYPFWAKKPEAMLPLHDMVQFTFRGIAMSHMDVLEPERLANLENMLAKIIQEKYMAAFHPEETASQDKAAK